MNKRILIAVLVVLLVALAGCSGAEDAPDEPTEAADTGDMSVEKVVIQEDEVVCYYFVTNGGYDGQGGLSCLPFSEVEGYGG